jgi:type III secretion protein D
MSENIQNILKDNKFNSLRVNHTSEGVYSISGFVMTQKERATLEKIVDENYIPAMLDIEIGEQLATEVRELFRLNGLEVVVLPLKSGEVQVTTKETNKAKIDKIQKLATQEIADLQKMQVNYINTEENKPTLGADVHQYKHSDKRITMVVDGDPSYIMTSDQSKYYIGAMLPTGYKVIDIIDQKVVLEKGGNKKTLNF